jgi:hypothetical protein
MAPWTHTYLSPQTERRMCCASREPAQNFQQYIDTQQGSGVYQPLTLEQHWNSDHMKSVRRRMMAGESLPECQVCDKKLLNTSVYRDYFWSLFQHRYDDIWKTTDSDGATTMLPISWDYRFSNLCNFKCRMCGDMLSSAWESEQRTHSMIDWSNPKNAWMRPEVRNAITEFQDNQVEKEFSEAVEQHRIEEIYWVGGEPLMYEQHWRYMSRIIELGDAKNLYARYNTNLSRCDYRGMNLWEDILVYVRDWQICASLDGTHDIGEYIRTGLDYQKWQMNFEKGLSLARHRRQMRIDFTLTLPGLLDVLNIEQLAIDYNVDLLCKVVFSFTPDIILSPLSLPRGILESVVAKILDQCRLNSTREMLQTLLTRPTFSEQWPHQWQEGLQQGKQRIKRLEKIRPATIDMDRILMGNEEIYAWWKNID